MKKIIAVAVLLLLGALRASAQTTTVTGTVIDANNNAYSNGTVSAFISLSAGASLPSGVPASGSIGPFPLNGSGVFSVTVASPNSWVFGICGTPVNVGPRGNPTPNSVCFVTPPIAISGGSQDVTSNLAGIIPLLGPSNPAATVTCTALNFVNARIKDTSCLAGADMGARINTCNSSLGGTGGICDTRNETSTTFSTAITVSGPITVLGCGSWIENVAGGITFSYTGGGNLAGGGGLQGCPGQAFVISKNVSGTLLRISGIDITISDVQIVGNANIGRTGPIIDPSGSTNTILERVTTTNTDVLSIQSTSAANNIQMNHFVASTPGVAASGGISLVGGSATMVNSTVAMGTTGDMVKITSAGTLTMNDSTITNSGSSGIGLNCSGCNALNLKGNSIQGVTNAMVATGATLVAIGNSFSGGVTECVLMGSNSSQFIGNIVNWNPFSGSGRAGLHVRGDTIGNLIMDNIIKVNAGETPSGLNYGIWMDTSAGGHFLGHRLIGNYISGQSAGTLDVGIFIDNTSNLSGSGITAIANQCVDISPNQCIKRVDAGNVSSSYLLDNFGNNGATYGLAGSTLDIIKDFAVAFADLPNAGPLSWGYCTNCTPTNPTTSGGPGANVFRINGTWSGGSAQTAACLLASAVSPLACGAADNGTVAVPATTTTYTINTTRMLSGSRVIFGNTSDNAGIPGAPACATPAQPFAIQTSRVAGTSFTFSLPSNAGITCITWAISQ